MSYNYPNVNVLVEDVKGTSNVLSGLISRKSGLIILLIVAGVIFSKLFIS